MQYAYRIVTININGIESSNRTTMLGDFLHRQDIDIALIQEITST
jgi:exonuclease III